MAENNLIQQKSNEEVQRIIKEEQAVKPKKSVTENIIGGTRLLFPTPKITKSTNNKEEQQLETNKINLPPPGPKKFPTLEPDLAAPEKDIYKMSREDRRKYLAAKRTADAKKKFEEFEESNKKEKLQAPDYSSQLNVGNFHPLFDDEKTTTGDYVYYPKGKKIGHIIADSTFAEAVKEAEGVYESMKNSGKDYYTPDYDNLNSTTRLLMEADMNWEEISRIIKSKQSALYDRTIEKLKNDPKYENLSEQTLDNIAVGIVNGKQGHFAIPAYSLLQIPGMAIGLLGRTARTMDSIIDPLPQFDGMFTGAWVNLLNKAQKIEGAFAEASGFEDNNILVLDNNINSIDPEDTSVKIASPKDPYIEITTTEFKKGFKDSSNPNVLVGAVRLLADEIVLATGVVTAVGRNAAGYYMKLAKEAEERLINRGIPAAKHTQKAILNEAKIVRKEQYEALEGNTKKTIGGYISGIYNDARIAYQNNPGRYTTEFIASEGVLNIGMATGEFYAGKWYRAKGELQEGATPVEMAFGVTGGVAATVMTHLAINKIVPQASRFTKKVGVVGLNILGQAQSLDVTNVTTEILEHLKLKPEQLAERLKSTEPLIKAVEGDAQLEKTMRSFLTKHVEFSRKDPAGAKLYLEALARNENLLKEAQDLGILTRDEVVLSLGAMAEMDVIKAAEYTIANQRSQATKVDTSFNFLMNGAALHDKKESLQKIIDRTLSKLSAADLSSKKDLSAFKTILQDQSVKLAGEQAELESILRGAIVYDAYQSLEGIDLSTTTTSRLEEVLNEFPALKELLPSEGLSKVQGQIAKSAKRIKQLNSKTVIAKRDMNKQLVKIVGLHDVDKIKFDPKGMLTINKTSQANRIKGYTSEVGLTILERVDDHNTFYYQGQYREAFNKLGDLPIDLKTMDVSKLMTKIDELNSVDVFKTDSQYLKKVEKIINPEMSKAIDKGLNELANIANEKLVAQGQNPIYTAKDIREQVKQLIIEKTRAQSGPKQKVGDISDYQILNALSNNKNIDVSLNIDIDNFLDLRRLTSDFERKYYKSDDKPQYGNFKKISDVFDETFDGYLDYLKKEGMEQRAITQDGVDVSSKMDDLVADLAKAEEDYKINFRDRQRTSLLYKKFLRYSERVDGRGYSDDLKEAAKEAITYEKGDIYRPVGMVNGQYPSKRIRSSNNKAESFFDDLLKEFNTRDSFLNELERAFGTAYRNKKGQVVYRFPKDGEPLAESFKHFISAFNFYVTAKQMKGIDELTLLKKTEMFKNTEKEFLDSDLSKLSPAEVKKYVESMGGGALFSKLGEEDLTLIKSIDEGLKIRTNNEMSIGGAKMYELIFKAAQESETLSSAIETTVDNITKRTRANQPKFDKVRAQTSELAGIMKKIIDKGVNVNNAQEFYQVASNSFDYNTGKSVFLEKVIETSTKYYGSREEAEKAVSNLLSMGFQHTHTKKTAVKKWPPTTTRIDQLEKDKGFVGKVKSKGVLGDRATRRTSLEDESPASQLDRIKDTTVRAPSKDFEYYVDGQAATIEMADNAQFIAKYIGRNNTERHRKLTVIFELSKLANRSGEQVAKDMNMVDPTHGNVKFGFNQAMSRIAAVYSGRASFRYPLAEMSFALMQKREADAVAALLQADGKFIDLVYNTMLTGEVDPKFMDSKAIESFFIDQTRFGTAIALGFFDHHKESTLEDAEIDLLKGIGADQTGENRIASPIVEDMSGLAGLIGQPGLGVKKRKRKIKTYREFVSDKIKEMMTDDDKVIFFEAFDKVTEELKNTNLQQLQYDLEQRR